MLVEGTYFLFLARVKLLAMPFKKIAPGLGIYMKETAEKDQSEHREVLRLIHQTIRRLSRRTPWESACLVQAMAAKRMLNRRGIGCTIYFGITKDEKKEKGLTAHAWLRSGNTMVTGAKGVNLPAYTVVSFFGDKGQ